MEVIKNGVRASALGTTGMGKGAYDVRERGNVTHVKINVIVMPTPLPDVMPTITSTFVYFE